MLQHNPVNTKQKIDFSKLFLLSLLITLSSSAQPTWSVYPANVMYSGEYKAFNVGTGADKAIGTFNGITQPIYRSDVTAANYFTSPPKVVLSLMGYKQNAPANGSTLVGFDARITTIRTTSFDVTHNIIGASMTYLNYMYLAILSTDYKTGQYFQSFDMNSANKSYSIDIAYNSGQTYPTYLTNKIQMKGFLSGYSMKQGTSTGLNLNFSMDVKDSSFFTISVSVPSTSAVDKICFYRITYDRTTIERKTYSDIFRDFQYELVNGVNTLNIYNASWVDQYQFQYRNYLMGTNKISIQGTVPVAAQFYLYYYFAESFSKLDLTYPMYIDNPAKAKYLYGQVFYHVIKSCTVNAASGAIYYLPTDRKCYVSCPALGFFQDSTTKSCIPCHFSCATCSAGNMISACSTCDVNYRVFNSTTSKCQCPVKKFDDGTNLACVSCHTSCLTCSSASASNCKSCNSTENRDFFDSDSDGIGQCVCTTSFYQNPTLVCASCSAGCLSCTVVSGNQTCSSCNTTAKFQLGSGACTCQSGFYLSGQACIPEVCGDGNKTASQQCDDNNTANGDGCSSTCTVQANHACFQNSSVSASSICYFNGTISMSITQVSKSPYANEVNLAIKIDADSINQQFLTGYLTNSPSLTLQDAARRLLLDIEKDIQRQSNPIEIRLLSTLIMRITSIRFDLSSRMLYLTFAYTQSFDITKKIIKFQPSVSASNPNSKYFYNSPAAIVSLQSTYNKIDTIFYDQADYKKALNLRYAFLTLIILYWIISLFFIVIGKGNIAMQMMIVLQLAYASLLSQDKLQITFGGLSQFGKYTAGINIQFLTNLKQCMNFISIDLSCSVIDNLNITFFIMVFSVLVFFALKIIDKILNYRGQKLFIANRQKKYMQQNERTDQNINPNNVQRQAQFNLEGLRNSQVTSLSSQALQERFYKEQQFIPKFLFNRVLDFTYFLSFITVSIWGMSICNIKEQIIPSIVLSVIIGVFYCGIWLYWFLKYFSADFSFVSAHKKVEATYKQQSESNSQAASQNNQNAQVKRKEIKVQFKNKLSIKFLKVFFYPIIWFSLLGISLILALTQAIGYVTQALVISGSLLLALIIWFTQIYKEKLHIFRSMLNCFVLCFIQIAYIVSQIDSISGSGMPATLVVICLLSLNLVSNTGSTLYLFNIERKLNNKKEQAEQIQKLKKPINKVQGINIQGIKLQVQRQNQIQNLGIFFKKDDTNSNSASYTNQQNERTVKKPMNYQPHSQQKMTQYKNKKYNQLSMPRQQYIQMFRNHNQNTSEPYLPQLKISNGIRLPKIERSQQKLRSHHQFQNQTQIRDAFKTKKKGLFTVSNYSAPMLKEIEAPSMENVLIDQNQVRIGIDHQEI